MKAKPCANRVNLVHLHLLMGFNHAKDAIPGNLAILQAVQRVLPVQLEHSVTRITVRARQLARIVLLDTFLAWALWIASLVLVDLPLHLVVLLLARCVRWADIKEIRLHWYAHVEIHEIIIPALRAFSFRTVFHAHWQLPLPAWDGYAAPVAC